MKTSTPFLPALRGCLFGRPPRNIHARMQAEADRIRRASLGKLSGIFGQYIHDPLLNPADNGPGSRQRMFSTRTTFWAFLSQVLSPDGSCREALRKLQAWQAAHGQILADASTSGYCQARHRLNLDSLREVHHRVAQEVQRRGLNDPSEFGRPVKVVDGTGVSMPDTPANQEQWPQTRAQKSGCGFPFAKLVGLFSLSNGVLIDWAEGSKHDHEGKLFRHLWDRLEPGDLLLADRGFCSYATIAALLEQGVDSLMRIHQARGFSFAQGKRLAHRDRLIQWQKPAQRPKGWTQPEWKALPQTVTLRLVEIKVEQPGFRVRSYVLITTLTDHTLWPAERLGRLYFRRWAIELFFRDIKISMGMDILRGKTPEMVRKEVVMHAIAYNCIRGVMQRVATLYHTSLKRLSFKGSVDALRLWADALGIHDNSPRKQVEMLKSLLGIMAHDTLPFRPDRSEPRVKKRRPKNYQLMNKPRPEMVVSSSRRWR